MKQLVQLTIATAFLVFTGCFAFNEDWTKNPSSKTDYLPGQQYVLLTNVFFSSEDLVLSRRELGESDSVLDAGTRLRVTSAHYNGDSFESGFYTTVKAVATSGPFRRTVFDVSFLSDGSHAFISRNPLVVRPVDATDPDLNVDHFAWAVNQIINYQGIYSWDWWENGEQNPDVILPIRFLLQQKQNDRLLEAFHAATTGEGKAYALSALERLDDSHFPALAKQLAADYPRLDTLHNCYRHVEPTVDVIVRMPREVELFYPRH